MLKKEYLTAGKKAVRNHTEIKDIASKLHQKTATLIKAPKMRQSDIKTVIDMLKAIARKEYKIPTQKLAILIAGVLYIINPMDCIPDVLAGGLIDDVTVWGYLLHLINNEMKDFSRLRRRN